MTEDETDDIDVAELARGLVALSLAGMAVRLMKLARRLTGQLATHPTWTQTVTWTAKPGPGDELN